MMKIRFYFLVFFAGAINLTSAIAQNPAQKLEQVFNRTHNEIVVVAHRGDWRNAPENSLHALLNSIDKGFDMMELDVKMTKDSQMVVMHDNTIDRTTNGKGKVSDFTLEEIKKFKLRNGLGRVTANPIPTFKELMMVAKNKILINVDKGNDHLPEVFKVLRETGTLQQAVVNVGDNIPYEKLISTEKIPAEAYIMVVVNMTNPNALKIIEGYRGSRKSAIQPIFNTDTLSNLKQLPQIAKNQIVWLNSLWPSLNGGHDDDRAVEQHQKPDSWGWLLEFNPVFIQSDRPADLIKYLKERKLHQ